MKRLQFYVTYFTADNIDSTIAVAGKAYACKADAPC